MRTAFYEHIETQLREIARSGLWKEERLLASPQGSRVQVGERQIINLCANNYLGLANHPQVVAAAQKGLAEWGYGLASVRFICGTQEIHRQLEKRLSEFLGTEDAILYSSCFDANGGLFETLLGAEDAVISDELNHASIIDGIRLCKATRLRYRHSDMADLEARLQEAQRARFRLIATDGVFSMDGAIANLPAICELADKYGALVMMDDSHGVGVLGACGRGTHAYHGVDGRVDIITGTLGKALGGASGGYAAGRRQIIDLLRQRSRPYLFSNTLAPPIAAASLAALELVVAADDLRAALQQKTACFRQRLVAMGFTVKPGEHPIVPIMIGDASAAQNMAKLMLAHGVYVVGFSYPVVPKGEARIRVQISAGHSEEDLDHALEAFAAGKAEIGWQ